MGRRSTGHIAAALLILALLLGLAAAPLRAAPDGLATLIADRVELRPGDVLWAEGHVEVHYRGQKLTATAISYDRKTEKLVITGPIRLVDAAGNVFTAEAADLSSGMAEGLLRSARLVLDQKLQLTAAEIMRSGDGRFTALRNAAASSCRVCSGNPTPLWEIRAREVVHDTAARRIYFTGATLRFVGVPVLYLPRLHVPDPTQDRATGFLFPRLKSSSTLGNGIKLPYFIVLGKSRDLTLIPYVNGRSGRSLDFRYRQKFHRGEIELNGALTRDRLLPDTTRGYLSLDGRFDLGRDYVLSFSGITVTDPAYLSDYDISGADRLRNELAVTRLQRDLTFASRLVGLRSLRDNETNATLPSATADLSYERRFSPGLIGGVLAWRLDAHADHRRSTQDIDTDGDGLAQGQDLARLGLSFDWRRDWITPQGLVVAALANGAYDRYRIDQDQLYNGTPHRLSGALGLELRWPLLRTTAGGATQTLEPIGQLVLSSTPDTRIPNADSTLVELDEGNLFALDRFPGLDAVEGGLRLNLGASFSHQAAAGWSWGMTAGRVFRARDLGQFSNASGLSGLHSDWLLAWSFTAADGFNLTNRLVEDDAGRLDKGELRFGLRSRLVNLSGGYEYLLADADEGRSETASEVVLHAERDLTRFWHGAVSGRYDLRAARLARTGLELEFRNECIEVALSVARSFASSASQRPNTDFGLTVELLGFGRSDAGPARSCRR